MAAGAEGETYALRDNLRPGGDVVYVAEWSAEGRRVVVVAGEEQRALQAIGASSAVGFVWGRPGEGARDLARSLLADATDSVVLAERVHREFARDVIAQLPDEGFRLTRADVLRWLETRPDDHSTTHQARP